MPILKSSKKALKVSHRRHQENLIHKDAYKSAIKKVRKSLTAGQTEKIAELLKDAKSTVDKAAKSKTIHKNKAARIKSRLAKKATDLLKDKK